MKLQVLLSVVALTTQAVSDRLESPSVSPMTTLISSVSQSAAEGTESTFISAADDRPSESLLDSLPASNATSLNHSSSTDSSRKASPLARRHAFAGVTHVGNWNVVFFASWIDNSALDNLPWHAITHVVYTYAKIEVDGTVVPGNPEVDARNMVKLNKIKRRFRHLKLLMSIGRPDIRIPHDPLRPHYDSQFDAVKDAKHWKEEDPVRDRFIDTAIGLMQDWGCEGIVIDWVYPVGARWALYNILKVFHLKLRKFESKFCSRNIVDVHRLDHRERSCRFWLALTMGWDGVDVLWDKEGLDILKDEQGLWLFENLFDVYFWRAFDYSGQHLETSKHNANLRGKPSHAIEMNTTATFMEMFTRESWSQKYIICVPMYGRAFIQDSPYFGSHFTKTNESDIVLYKNIDPSWDCDWDEYIMAAWCYDGTRLISYDDINTVKLKMLWTNENFYNGLAFTPIHGDQPGRNSLILAAWEQMSTTDNTRNLVTFPASQYAQLRGELDLEPIDLHAPW